MTILTLEEAKAQGLPCHSYNNGDYKYETEDGYVHLIRNSIDLLEGLKAVYYYPYSNGDYNYATEDGEIQHIKTGE